MIIHISFSLHLMCINNVYLHLFNANKIQGKNIPLYTEAHNWIGILKLEVFLQQSNEHFKYCSSPFSNYSPYVTEEWGLLSGERGDQYHQFHSVWIIKISEQFIKRLWNLY